MRIPDPTTCYAMLSVAEAADVTAELMPENEARPVLIQVKAGLLSSMLWLSREAAEALVDHLVATLVVGGDPDAAPF